MSPDTVGLLAVIAGYSEAAGVPVVGALCGLVYSFARSYRRQRRPTGDRPDEDAGV